MNVCPASGQGRQSAGGGVTHEETFSFSMTTANPVQVNGRCIICPGCNGRIHILDWEIRNGDYLFHSHNCPGAVSARIHQQIKEDVLDRPNPTINVDWHVSTAFRERVQRAMFDSIIWNMRNELNTDSED